MVRVSRVERLRSPRRALLVAGSLAALYVVRYGLLSVALGSAIGTLVVRKLGPNHELTQKLLHPTLIPGKFYFVVQASCLPPLREAQGQISTTTTLA